ncbi:MAG: hypothetical protein BWX72_01061 [Firmicutes bacterium ADurb.Bin080]|nr:MAG: hypothetical protein BWX72_01061 [Firmicutes bacterium ADurb.Bin080]
MKILKFISTLFFGIVLGVALTVGGVALGGYMVWTKEGSIGQVTDLANQYVGELPVNFGDDIKAMSLGTYVTSVISLVTDIGNAEVSEVENFLGTDFVSKGLSDVIGIDQAILQTSTFGNLGSTITNNLTVRVMQEKFDVSLASMPVFEDPDFLDSPIADAFPTLEQKNLDAFIDVVYDADVLENPELVASPQLLQSLGTTPLVELSSDFGTILNDMTVGELVDVNVEEGPDQSSKILIYLSDKKLAELDIAINTMTLSDAIDITEESHAVLQAIANDSLESLGDTEHMTEVINGLSLGDFIEITEDDEPILQALKDTSIGELSTEVGLLTVGDIFDSASEGVLSLVPDDTMIQDIPTVLSAAVADTSLYTLSAVGLFDITTPGVATRNTVYNSTVEDVVNAYAASMLPTQMVHWVVIYDGVLPGWVSLSPLNNPPFQYVNLQTLLPGGYITQVSATIDSVLTNNVWKISQNTLDNLHGEGIEADHATVFFPVGDIDIIIGDDVVADPPVNTFDRAISFHMGYLDGAGDLSRVLVGNDIRIVTERGGYIGFTGVTNHVYADADNNDDFTQLIETTNEPEFTFKMVKKDSESPEIPNFLLEYDPS